MGVIEDLAKDGINELLSVVVAYSGDQNYDSFVTYVGLTGMALVDISTKLEDKQLTQEEIDEVVRALAAQATPEQLEAIRSTLTKIFAGVFK